MDNKQQPALWEQTHSAPALLAQLPPLLEAQAADMVKAMGGEVPSRILLTGCGDSYAAAYAARTAFWQLAGLPANCLPTVELARHTPPEILCAPGTWVVAVSSSGNVSRVVELARRVRHSGGRVLAVTANPDSLLAQAATACLLLQTPKFHRSGPGLRSYLACVLALLCLAKSLGRARGGFEATAKELSQTLQELPALVQAALPVWDAGVAQLTDALAGATHIDFVADGPDYATAWFGYAKLLECAGLPGSAQNTEDWLHMNYFVRDVAHSPVLLVDNADSPAASRMNELAKVASEMGRPVLRVGDVERPGIKGFATPRLEQVWLQPLVQCLPLALLGSHMGQALAETDFRGPADNWSACIGFATVAASEQQIVEETP